MTSHRLIRCERSRLLDHVATAHPEKPTAAEAARLPHWRAGAPLPDRSAVWRTRLPDGSVLAWCLEVDQGAHGLLAHLSSRPVSGRVTRLPLTVQQLALQPWTARVLADLARAVEARPVGGG